MLFYLMVGLLAIVGFTSLIEWGLGFFGGGRCPVRRVTLIPVRDRDEEIEGRLRCAYNSMRWDRFIMGGRLLIVDMGADEETRAVCAAFAEGRGDVDVVDREDFIGFAGEEAVYKTLWSVLY